MYEDLQFLGCRIHNVTESSSPGVSRYPPGYTLVLSHNAFYELAKGESVVLRQYLTVYFDPYDECTKGDENVDVFLTKGEGSYFISLYWELAQDEDVTMQLTNERRLSGFCIMLPCYTTTKAGKAIQIQSVTLAGDDLKVYVQNVGGSMVRFIDGECLYVRGTLRAGSPLPDELAPGDTTTITLEDVAAELGGLSNVKIRAVTEDGTFTEATKSFD